MGIVNGNRIVAGNTITNYRKRLSLYAEATNLTTVPNEVCFQDADGCVIMHGRYIHDSEDLMQHYFITDKEIREMMADLTSLYDFAKTLKQRPHVIGFNEYNSLEEFKALTVGDKLIDYLREGKTLGSIFEEYSPILRKRAFIETANSEELFKKEMLGPAKLSFGTYGHDEVTGKYFDYATVEVSIYGLTDCNKEERMSIIKKNKKVLDNAALEKLSRSSRFKKTGLSTNYVKCDNCTLTRDNTMIYKLSWKIENPKQSA